MAHLVTHESDGTVATILMDDGKVNVLSLQMVVECWRWTRGRRPSGRRP